MSKVLGMAFGDVKGLKPRHDDDLSDRLVSRYSTTVFITLCVIITTSTYVGKPIDCWCPAEFTGTQSNYANAKCLISPTYSVPEEDVLPQSPAAEKHINYYVWVPFILLCQAALCVVPSIMWKSCYKGAGFNVPSIIERLESSQNLGWENRESAVKYVVEHLQRYTKSYQRIALKGPRTTWYFSKTSGNYLHFCYMLTKFLYIVVTVGQFVLLNYFLGMDFNFFGLDMIHRFSSGGDNWSEMNRFPKVTICEFTVRHMHRIQPWVVQCVLPINLFNEKIFLFIWFWLAVLSACTVFSFLKWVCKTIAWQPQIYHVKRLLLFKVGNRPKDFKSAVEEFTKKRLRRDTLFLLRILSHNVGALTEADVIKGLWDGYYNESCPPPEPYDNDSATTLMEVVGSG